MNLFGVMDISASALMAERQRAEVVTSNLANADNAAADPGRVYQRREVVFAAQAMPFDQVLTAAGGGPAAEGVAVTGVVSLAKAAVRRYEPGNPLADQQGYVNYPDINPVEEMTDLMGAVRSYQLNASAVEATKGMIEQSLTLLK